LFDDTATGTTGINVAAAVTPATIVVSNNTLPYTFSGGNSINATLGLTKQGSGTLTMGVPNIYPGNALIQAGTLRLGASNVLPSGSGKGNVIVNGLLDLNGFNQNFNSLAGTGNITNSS